MSTTLLPVTWPALPATGPQLLIEARCLSPGAVAVDVAGEIDLSTTNSLHAALLGALFPGLPHRLEVDLAGVTFMDCGGLTVLVLIGDAAARVGCQLRVTNPQPVVRRLLDLSGLLGPLTARFDPAPCRPLSPSPIGPAPRDLTRPAVLIAA